MKDFIPRGTGDSRLWKSVSDFKTRYPTYDAFVAALVAGTLPLEFNGINPDGVEQAGTAYSKANMLTDETAALYGLDGDDATVNQALAKIGGTFGGRGIYYAVCSTEDTDDTKVLTIPDFKLEAGTRISVYFINGFIPYKNDGVVNTHVPFLKINGGEEIRVYAPETMRAFVQGWYNGFFPAYAWTTHEIVDFVYAGEDKHIGKHWTILSKGSTTPYLYRTTYIGTGTHGKGSGNHTEIPLGGFPQYAFIRSDSEFCCLTGPFITSDYRKCGFTVWGGSTDSGWATSYTDAIFAKWSYTDTSTPRLFLASTATSYDAVQRQMNVEGTTYYATFINSILPDWLTRDIS